MDRPDYDSPSNLKKVLESRGYTMQKKFGQNFLVNKSAREKIIAVLGSAPGDTIWEIGPGLGAMTSLLLDFGLKVTAFEIDHGFIGILNEIFGDNPNFKLVPGDVLKTWERQRDSGEIPGFVFGNLPYNIASAIIADFIEQKLVPRKMVFMVQKETADRMKAKADTDHYSSFSVLCQSSFSIKSVLDLKPGSFWPMPDVMSSVISMEPRNDFPYLEDRSFFLCLTRGLFATRRKTLKNNLKPLNIPMDIALSILQSMQISPECRAETLSPEKIAMFSNNLSIALRGHS